MVKGFQKRFFVLDDEVLSYYKDEKNEVREKGQVSLRLIKIDPKGENDKKVTIYTGTSEMHLKFKSIQEKNDWLDALATCQNKLMVQSNLYNSEIMIEDKDKKVIENEQQQQLQAHQQADMDREIKEALSLAIQTHILKPDSLLNKYVADTWLTKSNLDEALHNLRIELQKCDNPKLLQIGEKIETYSNELKQNITYAIKQIEEAQLVIEKIIKAQSSLKKGEEISPEVFKSFAKEVHLNQEKVRKSDIYKQILQEEEKKKQEEDEDENFFDAEDEINNDANLEVYQSNIHKLDESVMETNRETEERLALPTLRPAEQKVSIWKIIKDAVGKDLSKFAVPVYFNEPISMVQKVAEVMEYENLIVKAADDPNPFKRLLYITAFGVAQYKCSPPNRLNKPFNPILGETFELKRQNYLYFAEQVSHHPPISAAYATSAMYEMWMDSFMKTAFWGKSLEVKPVGLQNVRLKTTDEHFSIDRPISAVYNIIFGDMYVEHQGKMTSKNYKTGDYCEIEFKKRGWSGKNFGQVEGYAYNNKKEKMYKIWGKWTESLFIQNLATGEEEMIWQGNPLPPNADKMYHFTHFALQLNHLPDSLKPNLPRTDSRFRPDQRALEEGDLKLATSEKIRLEEKQRKMRKDKEAQGIEYQCKYFEEYVDPDTGEKAYKYGKRDYWADRKKKDWGHLDDLF